MVKTKLPRQFLNSKMVNRTAPDLFPIMFILKKPFIWRNARSIAALTGRKWVGITR